MNENDKKQLVNLDDVEMIHKKTVSELVEILGFLSANILTKTQNLTKEINEADSKISVSKEELNDKLSVLDKYFVKLSTIQKEVIGDKGLKKQSKEIVKLITDDFIKISFEKL